MFVTKPGRYAGVAIADAARSRIFPYRLHLYATITVIRARRFGRIVFAGPETDPTIRQEIVQRREKRGCQVLY